MNCIAVIIASCFGPFVNGPCEVSSIDNTLGYHHP